MRSKDGVKWVTDPGEAYMPGIAVHQDGRKEDWFKYERIKILQDEYGRAIQANFAVIDTLKDEDKPNDRHSSKNISIPLNPGVRMKLLNSAPITSKTQHIRLLIQAEPGFNPQSDMDIASLRFGASTEVNFGGGSTVVGTKKSGKDLVVIFSGKGHGITADEFAPKLLGRKKNGELLFGYTRLPGVNYIEPILSARKPKVVAIDGKSHVEVVVENFGQVASEPTSISVLAEIDGKEVILGRSDLPAIKPYGKETIEVNTSASLSTDSSLKVLFGSKE